MKTLKKLMEKMRKEGGDIYERYSVTIENYVENACKIMAEEITLDGSIYHKELKEGYDMCRIDHASKINKFLNDR